MKAETLWELHPVTAIALLAFVFFYQRQSHTDIVATQGPVVRIEKAPNADDRSMLAEVNFSTPAVRQTRGPSRWINVPPASNRTASRPARGLMKV